MIWLILAAFVLSGTVIVSGALWVCEAGGFALPVDRRPTFELFFAGMCLTIVLALFHFIT